MRFIIAALLAMAFVLPAAARAEVEFLFAEFEEAPFLNKMTTDDGITVYAGREPQLTNADIASAVAQDNPAAGMSEVRIIFTKEGAERLKDFTASCIGKPIAIVADGKLIAAPVVQEAITGGEVVITGVFTSTAAHDLAASIAPPPNP
ncbi:Protein translocase subunit SecD [Alphaproteobacteria bacterium SO-S41]|nr:Protein translocase subunit SecD [Alphaproteobacteria bacterium SO-S41]